MPSTSSEIVSDAHTDPDFAGRTLDAVINTHHHGDHTGGNAVFRPATKTIVAHANVPALMRARAEAAPRPAGLPIEILDGTAEALPYADRSFDATLLCAVLHHVDDPGALLAEAMRVARS